MSNTISKKRRVMDYLAAGNSLTAGQARGRFGVSNMRATISDIKSQVEKYGNWRVVTEETSNGTNRYFLRRVVLTCPTGV